MTNARGDPLLNPPTIRRICRLSWEPPYEIGSLEQQKCGENFAPILSLEDCEQAAEYLGLLSQGFGATLASPIDNYS